MRIILNNEQDSAVWARNFAGKLAGGDVVTLEGELGAGKSFLCREIIRSFCGQDVNVISPTFNLLQTYKTKDFIIYHFDLYRLKSIDEIYEIGIEDALNNNLCLIEWSEIIESILPVELFKINLEILEGNKRLLSLVSV